MVAEVSDKMPAVADCWILGTVVAFGVGLACWRFRGLVFVLGPLTTAVAGMAALGLFRPDDVDVAWMKEQGRMAVYAAYGVWFLPPLTSLIGLVLSRGRRRRHEGQSMSCRSCGYCLTGNAIGVCPECGTAVDTPSAGGAVSG
jgi:hypothetical protein